LRETHSTKGIYSDYFVNKRVDRSETEGNFKTVDDGGVITQKGATTLKLSLELAL